MTTQLSDLAAKLIEVAEGLEGKARRAADKSRKAAEAWKPVGCPDPSKLLEGVERLAQSLRIDEVEGVVAGLREIVPDDRRRLRVLGALLRLTSDEIAPVVAEAVADERPGAIKAASIDALFVADLQSLRVAILTARGSAAPIDGASRAKALRHLLSVAPPPGEPSNQGLAFDDLARLCLHSMQMLLSAIKADTMVMAMVRAPQPVADRVAASQTRGARRIFDEAVDIARSRASPEDIRKARRIVLDWSAESLRRGDIVFMAPSRTSDAGGHDA